MKHKETRQEEDQSKIWIIDLVWGNETRSKPEADKLCHAQVIAALIFRHFYQVL